MRSITPSKQAMRIGYQQSGFSLIEVLVAILVVALGIVTMLAMQVNSIQFTKTSEVRTMGAMLVGDLADRMRANPQGVKDSQYVLNTQYPADGNVSPPAASTNCAAMTTTCDADTLARVDTSNWLNTVFNSLPGGSAWVSAPDTTNAVDVWLVWVDPVQRNPTSAQNTAVCPANLVAAPAQTGGSQVAPQCMYFRINL